MSSIIRSFINSQVSWPIYRNLAKIPCFPKNFSRLAEKTCNFVLPILKNLAGSVALTVLFNALPYSQAVKWGITGSAALVRHVFT